MKMPLVIAATIFALAAPLMAQQATPKPPRGPIVQAHTTGRFQLFNAAWGLPFAVEQSCVFRIDSETGKTWILWPAMPSSDPKVQAGWIELAEYVKQQEPVAPH